MVYREVAPASMKQTPELRGIIPGGTSPSDSFQSNQHKLAHFLASLSAEYC